jgi:hypothetical protein
MNRSNLSSGLWMMTYGSALLIWAAAIVFTANTDTWNAVGIVLGLLGGLGIGVGLALLFDGPIDPLERDQVPNALDYPEYPVDDEDYAGEYVDALRLPPEHRDYPDVPAPVCIAHDRLWTCRKGTKESPCWFSTRPEDVDRVYRYLGGYDVE